jgi:5-methylthioadenosine/S-adenosylhomocysteine deaminase
MLSACLLALLAAAPAAAEPYDLVVRNGTVVTVDGQDRVIPDGAIAARKGRIVYVGPARDLPAAAATVEHDARGGLVLPGLVNAHTHAPMVLFRGVADDLKLMDWLQQYIFPAEARNVTADFVKAGTRLAALEMIRSGTTTFVDMYYFEEQVAEACDEAGMRCVPGETLIEFPAPDNKTVPDALAYTEKFLARWKGHPRVHAAVAPHSTYLVEPDNLRKAKALADRFSAPLLVHVSESKEEKVRGPLGPTPTQHLAALGFLRKGVVMAHGVYLDAKDRALARAAEVGVVHCPQSNMKLASGGAPVAEMLKEGLRLGLGTDGAASNNDLDMFEEMMTAAILAKHRTEDPTAAPARDVLRMATLGGARAIGMESEIGSLEVGKRADLVVVATTEPRLQPMFEPVSHLVYAVKGSDVRDVVVEGRVIMKDRVVLTLDEKTVLAEADRLRAQVVGSLQKK